MQTHTIDNELSDLELLKSLAQAYARIAAVRMQKTRANVLSNRGFLDALSAVFYEVLAAYSQKLKRMRKKKNKQRGDDITFLSHNGRTVAVLLSVNAGLYGAIVQDVFSAFLKEVKDPNIEVTIIGRMGRVMFEQMFPKRSYTYFELPDYQDRNDFPIRDLMKHLVQYETIHVYHGKFVSFINQEAARLEISANKIISTQSTQTENKYLFEPNMERILGFFESAIFSSLFSQSLNESQLARLASRAYAMNNAEDSIKEIIGKKKRERLKLAHRIRNRKQQGLITNIYRRK